MNNQEKFHTLVRLAGHTRTHQFQYTTEKGTCEDQIALLIGYRADLAVVLIDEVVYLLSRAYMAWDALDYESLREFEIDTVENEDMLEFIVSRWCY